jgi:hypothetical protein
MKSPKLSCKTVKTSRMNHERVSNVQEYPFSFATHLNIKSQLEQLSAVKKLSCNPLAIVKLNLCCKKHIAREKS